MNLPRRLTDEERERILDLQSEVKRAVALWAVSTSRASESYLLDSVQPENFRFESPIEALFWVWWQLVSNGDHSVLLARQHRVTIEERQYRLDFAVLPGVPFDRFGRMWGRPLQIAVELDGHEFHERTPAQVESRDQRDRDLARAGWRVMHFSGREFNRNPMQVVHEVWSEASNHIISLMLEFERWHDRNQAELARLR
jgi:hypothetical protein